MWTLDHDDGGGYVLRFRIDGREAFIAPLSEEDVTILAASIRVARGDSER